MKKNTFSRVPRMALASVCSFAVLLAPLTFSGCTQLRHAEATLRTWLRDYALGKYRATPQQVRVADERATRRYNNFSPAKKRKMKQEGTRYIAVRTLDPSPKQLKEIRQKASSAGAGSAYGATTSKKKRSGYGSVASSTPSGERPAPASTAAPAQEYKCVMIWDTYAKEVVGNDCYAVTDLPPVGTTARFSTYSAEYVGL